MFWTPIAVGGIIYLLASCLSYFFGSVWACIAFGGAGIILLALANSLEIERCRCDQKEYLGPKFTRIEGEK